jgi:ABC-type uncharacterized transport system permease subunit
MNFNLIDFGQAIPAVLLLGCIAVMVSSLSREDAERFKICMYIGLVASVVSAFMFSIRITHLTEINVQEIAVATLTMLLMVSTIIGLSYQTIHGALPQLFVRTTGVFTIALLFASGAQMAPHASLGTQHSNSGRFVESDIYQQEKEKAQAGFAAQIQPKSMPQ